MLFRAIARTSVNRVLRKVGLRLVSSSWGPRGVLDALSRVQKQGVMPRQIVDVGASSGAWTRGCLQVFPRANYFLIDPLEENTGSLQQLEREYPQVKVAIGALGAKPGKLSFHVHGDQSSFLNSEYSDRAAESVRFVEVKPMDWFLNNGVIGQPDMIKTDVQGYELEVLKGAERCLTNAQLLLLEVLYRRLYEDCPLAHEVISYAGSKGFRIYDICTYVMRPNDDELAYSDILFAKENSPLFSFEGWNKA